MTEKRYNLYNVGSSYLTSCGITTGEDCFENMTECCEELNRLSDKNEKLKFKNRGLQSELQIFKEDATHSNLQINKLADENKQLKADKQSLIDFIKKELEFWKKQAKQCPMRSCNE